MKNICVHFKRYARTSFALTHCIMNGLHSCYLLRNLFYTHLQRIRPLSKVWNMVFRFTRQLHKHTPLIFIFICIVYDIYFLKEICLPFYDPWVYHLYIIYFNFTRHLRMFTQHIGSRKGGLWEGFENVVRPSLSFGTFFKPLHLYTFRIFHPYSLRCFLSSIWQIFSVRYYFSIFAKISPI